MEESALMQKHRSSETARSILHPTTPIDIGPQRQRLQIIEAMIESCAEKTYPATTIGDIVARAHISRTTFYKQFDDKRDCFDVAVAQCILLLQEVAGEAHDAADSPADAARKAAVAVLEAMAERPSLAQLLTGDAVAVDPAAIERYRRATIPALEALWSKSGEVEAHSDPRLAFGQVQVLIFNEIVAGRADRLPDLRPEIVYLTVAPFGGHKEAMRQSRLAADQTPAIPRDGDR
jgi:AcrR family transcriptional regulator